MDKVFSKKDVGRDFYVPALCSLRPAPIAGFGPALALGPAWHRDSVPAAEACTALAEPELLTIRWCAARPVSSTLVDSFVVHAAGNPYSRENVKQVGG